MLRCLLQRNVDATVVSAPACEKGFAGISVPGNNTYRMRTISHASSTKFVLRHIAITRLPEPSWSSLSPHSPEKRTTKAEEERTETLVVATNAQWQNHRSLISTFWTACASGHWITVDQSTSFSTLPLAVGAQQPSRVPMSSAIMLRWDSRRSDKNEQKTLDYLQSSTRSSCLEALDAALSQLLKGVRHVNQVFSQHATVDSAGKLVWTRSSFDQRIGQRLPPDTTTFAPLLWHMFLSAAYYPFVPEPIDCDDDATLDLTAFRRAFAFLVLNGRDLYGLKQDGSYIKNCGERVQPIRLSHKVPRLARIIFRCLVTYSSASQNMEKSQDDSRFQDIKDTLLFTQPLPKRTFTPLLPRDLATEYDAATNSLLGEENSHLAADLGPHLLQTQKLQNLLQLLLLLRPAKNVWRKPLTSRNSSTLRSSEVRYCDCETRSSEAARASDYASAVIRTQFGPETKHVPSKMLTEWCQTCVSSSDPWV